MTTDPSRELLGDNRIPTISLAGVKWPVPLLAPKQNEVVVPTILRLWPQIMKASVRGEDGKSRLSLDVLTEILTPASLHSIYDCIFLALQRGHKALTRDEFDDMSIGVIDAIESLLVISKQTGVIREAKKDERPLDPAGQASPPTGAA